MTRDHSATAWTPDWLGENPGTADERPTAPAHAAPDPEPDAVTVDDTETRELIDLGQYEQAEHDELEKREQARIEPRRPLKSDGWAEERETGWADRPSDPSVGSLRSLGAVAVTGRRSTRPPSSPRPAPRGRRNGGRGGSAYGLAALVFLALTSAFLAWVTAEPLWLAVGHAEPGTVTVTKCHGDRCLGTFSGGGFVRDAIPVRGDVPATGEPVPAEMTSKRGANTYVGVDAKGRAGVGVALIVLCGLGIVRATGVRRLPTRPSRRTATLLSLAGPLTLLAAMLVVTF